MESTHVYILCAIAVVILVIIVLRSKRDDVQHYVDDNDPHCARCGAPPLDEALKSAGWTLYMRDGCHFCDKQKQELGTVTPACAADHPAPSDVEGFPEWRHVSGKKLSGLQTKEALRNLLKK